MIVSPHYQPKSRNTCTSKPVSTHCTLLALTIWQRALWPQCKWDCFAASTVSGGGGMGGGKDYGHPERAFFQKLETFGLGQTNWAEIL